MTIFNSVHVHHVEHHEFHHFEAPFPLFFPFLAALGLFLLSMAVFIVIGGKLIFFDKNLFLQKLCKF
jgi:hypothetical protein